MACTYPLKAYRAPGGRIVFKVKDGYIDRPLDIPCGQCLTCKLGKAQAWATRCYHESQLYKENSFITLTYDDEHLPLGWTLVLKHWQDFAKERVKNSELSDSTTVGNTAINSADPTITHSSSDKISTRTEYVGENQE